MAVVVRRLPRRQGPDSGGATADAALDAECVARRLSADAACECRGFAIAAVIARSVATRHPGLPCPSQHGMGSLRSKGGLRAASSPAARAPALRRRRARAALP